MSRAILLNKRRKKKPVSLPRYTLSQAATDQMNQDNSLSSIMNTDAFKLSRGNVNADGYIDQFMPPPPVLYSNPEENDFGQLDYKPRPSLEINYVGQEDSTSPRVNASNAYGMPAKYKAILEAEAADKALVDEANAVLDGVEGNGFEDYTLSNATQPVSYENERYNTLPKEALGDPYDETPPVMKDALGDPYDETPPVLKDNTKKGGLGETDTNNGVLNTQVTTTASEDRMSSPVSGNARGSMMPFAKINRNEALMRIGGAMVGGSSQGFSGAMKAATDEFGNIQDANRQAETDAFNKAEATRLAEERIAALKAKADAKNAKTPNTAAMQYGMAALNAIDRIEALVNAEQKWVPWDNTTGLIGNFMKSVPASAANDVLANIKTIEAAVGFDRLQAMRDASPTGGALGQVSNIELDLLKSSLGNLNQSQSKEQFMMNLKQVQRVYNEIVHTDIHSPNRKTTVETDTNNDLSDDEKKYLGL